VAPKVVIEKIEGVTREPNSGPDWLAGSDLEGLIDHLLDTHHVFTREEIVNLIPLMEKVVDRHGHHRPELPELKTLFTELANDLLSHLQKEEMVLFPYIRDIEAKYLRGLSSTFPPFGTVKHPVGVMMNEHDTAGDLLKAMRRVTNDYSLPEGACPSYAALYTRLEAFERDLHQHIHLENNLLFPKAIEIEEKLFS
jgi:regulator of cell morphogenesis and NO signaling